MNDTLNNNLKQEFPAEPHHYGGQEDFDEYGQQDRFEVVESTPPQQHGQKVGANLHRDEVESSNLYHQMKEESRKYFKSKAIQTSFDDLCEEEEAGYLEVVACSAGISYFLLCTVKLQSIFYVLTRGFISTK